MGYVWPGAVAVSRGRRGGVAGLVVRPRGGGGASWNTSRLKECTP